MKKLICILISLLISFNVLSCSQRQAQPQQGQDQDKQGQGQENKDKEKQDKPDKKEGEKILNNYAKALVLRDNKINIYYSENMKQHTANYTPMSNPHPNGYTVDKVEEKEGRLEGTLKMFMVYTGEPYYSSDESKITVVKEKGMYLIDKIEKSKITEVSEKDKSLYIREDGDVKGKEIIKIDDLPRFATPQGSSPDKKFNIGRDKFGPVALDPEDKTLALSTTGQHPAIMILEMKKKQVKPLDLYFEGNVISIAWSQDGKFLAVELSGKENSRFIRVYDIEKEKLIDDPIKESLKPERFSINNPYWISEKELVFNVSGVSTLTPGEQKKAGAYKLDVKNVNLTKF